MRMLIIAAACTVGCAAAGAHPADLTPRLAVLTVTNQRTEQAAVYLVRNGHRARRLGDVNGLRSATFVLNANDTPAAADLQFLAIFSTGLTELSDVVVSARGVTYEWRLAPLFGQQFLSLSYWENR